MLGVLPRLGERHLVRAIGPLDRQAVDDLGPGPALGRFEDDHRPARPGRDSLGPGVGLDSPDLGHDLVERRRHQLVHRLRIVAFDEIGAVAVAAHQLLELLAADAGQHRRVGDLVAVQVQDRQHRAVVARGRETCCRASSWPAGRSRPRRRRRRRRRSGRGYQRPRRTHGSGCSPARPLRGSSPAFRAPRGWESRPGNENCLNSRLSPAASCVMFG